ncbi:MAG: hypothetical protein J6M38_02895, partial [Lentisphaeria bacterium]|nr:hypothetical protein [Lentisphaeria bacterium]
RQEVPVRNPAKIWSEEAVRRLIQEKGTAYNVQTALKNLTVNFFESGVPELFSKEYPEQEELCLRERMENRPELLLELLARILILELKPRPERMKSRLPKSTINKGTADPESHSFRFLKHNVEQVAAAESYVELWRVSRHIGYTLDEVIKLSKTEKKRLDHSVQEYSLAMGMEEEPSINNVKDWIFLLIRAMISDRDRDVERCREHVNTVLDQMLQGKGGDSRG